MLFTPQKSYIDCVAVHGGCFKTMVFFFRGPFPRNWIRLYRIWFAEWHRIPQALLLLLVLPTVWMFPMTPMAFLQGPLRAWCATRKRACRPPRNWSNIPLLPGGSSEPIVSLNHIFLLFNHLGKTTYTAYTAYTPYPSICGVRHLQTSFNQHIMRWTSRSGLTNWFLEPLSQPSLHLYKKPITPGRLVWLCFWNWKALANTPKNSKETTHTTCIAHHPIHP